MLTARQQEIWQFLVEYVDGHGYPPTVREIGEHVGLASPSTVHAHLANLERAGLIRRDPTKPRAIELVGHRSAARRRRAASDPMPRLPLARPRRGRRAAARRGERRGRRRRAGAARARRRLPAPRQGRLDDRGRHPRRRHARRPAQDDARNGEIVVALAGDDETADEATVKRFYRERRPRPAAAREHRARAHLRRPRPGARQGGRGVPEPAMSRDLAARPHARPGALGARPRGQPGVPGVRRVRAARARAIACPECRTILADGPRVPEIELPSRAGRVTAGASALEESPDTAGQDAGETQAAKADGKWNRKETAGGKPPVRVKRWGKSPPATVATRRLAKPRPVQGEAGPADAARRGTGYAAAKPEMVTLDRIRLTGLLQKSPACGAFPFRVSLPVHGSLDGRPRDGGRLAAG